MSACPRCRALNPAGERACLSCGAALSVEDADVRCPLGHPVDASWAVCPYCALEGASPLASAPAARRPAEEGGSDQRVVARGPAAGHPGGGAATRLGSPPVGRRTRLQDGGGFAIPPQADAPGTPPAEVGPQVEPDLVAVLVAPELPPGGEVFAIRSGKSYIGAHPSNDVSLPQDPRVSGEHALLLARHGRFYLCDRISTNGTWVNGEEVEAGGQRELADRDRIRCGGTELILLVLPRRAAHAPRPLDQGESQ